MFRRAQRRWARLLVAGLLAVASPAVTRAADCAAPQETLVRSANGRFAVRIVPGHVAPFDAASPLDAARPSPVERPARAILYEVGAGDDMRTLSTFELHDWLAPAHVLLSNDGQRLITSGDWCCEPDHLLYFTIYRTDGTVVRALRPLLQNDAGCFYESLYPPEWLHGSRIDDETDRLVLDISGCPEDDCTYPVAGAIEIDLREGKTVRAGPSLPTFEPRVTVLPLPAEEAAALVDLRQQCPDAAREDLPHVGFAELAKLHIITPVYTETGKRARVVGRVVLQLVLEHGRVDCVAVLKDLPMGLGAAARDAAKRWAFRPASRDQLRMTTTVAVDFAMARSSPPAIAEVLAQCRG